MPAASPSRALVVAVLHFGPNSILEVYEDVLCKSNQAHPRQQAVPSTRLALNTHISQIRTQLISRNAARRKSRGSFIRMTS